MDSASPAFKIAVLGPKKIMPTGGPAGYLYNLLGGSNSITVDGNEIYFLSIREKTRKPLIKTALVKLSHLLGGTSRQTYIYERYKRVPYIYRVNLHKFEALHFHTTLDLYRSIPHLKKIKYRGKVLVSSHSPVPLHIEMSLPMLREQEELALRFADHVVFPCIDALEPYTSQWKEFLPIVKAKLIYVTSGILEPKTKTSPYEIRANYNIPENAKIMCYVGRHNTDKGYDQLLKIGKQLLDKNEEAFVLVAGKEEPLKGLDHPRWIEVGWTDDPHSIIAASNLFILPNRATYFDLILLEVLALDKPVLLTNTGGNKYFKELTGHFEFYEYGDISYPSEKANEMLTELNNERSNRILFQQQFTHEIFQKNYLKMVAHIL